MLVTATKSIYRLLWIVVASSSRAAASRNQWDRGSGLSVFFKRKDIWITAAAASRKNAIAGIIVYYLPVFDSRSEKDQLLVRLSQLELYNIPDRLQSEVR